MAMECLANYAGRVEAILSKEFISATSSFSKDQAQKICSIVFDCAHNKMR